MAGLDKAVLGHVYASSLPFCFSIMEQELGLKSLEFVPERGPLSFVNERGNYLPLFLRPDFAIGRTTMINGHWQMQDPAFFASQLATHNECCVIDVGANIGLFTRQLLHMVKNKIKQAYCYEPDLVNFRYLQKNLKHFPHVVLKPVGLSNIDAKAELFIDPLNSGNYSIYSESVPGEDINKQEITLLSAVSQKDEWLSADLPLFYKSDTQGHDLTIATALGVEFWDSVNCAILELYPLKQEIFNQEMLVDILQKFKYKALASNPQKLIETNEVIEFLKDSKNFRASEDLLLWRSV